ncbi:MAG TPA: cbb3-type cytochrome c oxidase N-terminal domain-containing protein [Ignavibacteria bacterium]|nr:cbb3-type cytochrome c oxidase N-terminal domain-containing protein [Ignavibacteria bacterium]
MRKILNNKTAAVMMMLVNAVLFAQTTGQTDSASEYSKLAGAMVFLLVAFLFVLFFILSSPKYKYSYERREKGLSLIGRLSQKLNRAVPLEREKDIMLDHDFDGIKELNNSVPPWFNLLFYGTILIAIIYMIDYHVLGTGTVMVDEYLNEVKIANEKREELIRTGAFINENNVVLLTDAAELDKGKQIWTTNCTPCHGPDGGGTVGPNLTDKNWIHGGGIKNVFMTVSNGVPAKGMISWKTLLTPKQVQQVSSYVLSLQGTTPANGKPPEGNLWVDSVKTGNDSVKVTDTSKVKTDSVKVKTDTSKVKKDSIKVK